MRSIEEEQSFQQARKQLVAKRVDAIQRGRNSFTLVETKAINYMISKIKPEDNPNTIYTFHTPEFCRMIQWKRMPTRELLGMLQTLANKSWWIETDIGNGKKKHELHHWFDIVSLNEGTGTISITFSKTVQPYVFNLIEQQKQSQIYFASWTADAISLMKNPYAPRLFELLRSFLNKEEWTFENGTGSDMDLQLIIADTDMEGNPIVPKSWSNWAIFNRNVLVPSMDEINKYTDIVIDYQPLKHTFDGKKTRKYSSIQFSIAEKTKLEKEQKEEEIANEYGNVISKSMYHQMTVEETDEFAAKREAAKKTSEEYYRQRSVESSKYPILMDEMPELSEKQVELLAQESIKFCPKEFLGTSTKDLWQADYITAYYKFIKATPEDTRASLYARLYDCVCNDYKQLAIREASKYFGSGAIISEKSENIVNVVEYERPNVTLGSVEDFSNIKDKKTQSDEEKEEQLLDLLRRIG